MWSDDEEEDRSPNPWVNGLGGLFGMISGGSRYGEPKPTTNAGRYLKQLKDADDRFDGSRSAISEEMQASLRRIQIWSARP